jgi:hypothetical protein
MRWLDDEEMSDRVADWLQGGQKHPEFFTALARAAILANEAEYEVLRPALLEMAVFENRVPTNECVPIAL